MIINSRKLRNKQKFIDPRGESGMSGQLYTIEDADGVKYIIKTKLVDVVNEYVAHKLAQIIEVPTSEAVLISNTNKRVYTGIVYEADFRHVGVNDFWGLEEYPENDLQIPVNGVIMPHIKVKEMKYPDDSPFLADVMMYQSFRRLIALDDNEQIAFSRGRVISFDYADAFSLSERNLSNMLYSSDISEPFYAFSRNLFLKSGYEYAIVDLRRADSDFLRNAYYTPMKKFLEADFTPLIEELDSIFPPAIPAFYIVCFNEIRDRITENLSKDF